MNVLEVHNLSFSYDSKPLLENITFSLKKGEFLSIVGASGCGKTTIIKIIAGIEKKEDGEIKSASFGYMPQKDLLLPFRNVISNILLPLEIGKKNLAKGEEIAIEYLKKLGLYDYAQAYPQELSGGMKQRISFLRTLMTQGEILLLDEPFSALDMITKENLQRWLLEILDEFKKSVIFITHDINEAIFLSDRILVCQISKDDSSMNGFYEFILDSTQKNSPEYVKKIKDQILDSIRGEIL